MTDWVCSGCGRHFSFLKTECPYCVGIVTLPISQDFTCVGCKRFNTSCGDEGCLNCIRFFDTSCGGDRKDLYEAKQ